MSRDVFGGEHSSYVESASIPLDILLHDYLIHPHGQGVKVFATGTRAVLWIVYAYRIECPWKFPVEKCHSLQLFGN